MIIASLNETHFYWRKFNLMGKSSWPNKKIVLLGLSSSFYRHLKEILRGEDWSIEFFVHTPAEAISIFENRKATLLIIDDSFESPAPNLIRILMKNPITFATPILLFLLEEHKYEKLPMNYMGFTELLFKPLTPSEFQSKLFGVVRRWELKPFEMLRKVYHQYLLTGDAENTEALLLKVHKVKELKYLLSPLIALFLMKLNRPKEAEMILLEQIKTAPKSLASVVILGSLYLEFSMPHVAKRLFTSAQNQFDFSRCLLPDLVHADFLLSNYEEAIFSLKQMIDRSYLLDTAQNMIARLYCSLGQSLEAEDIMKHKKGLLQKIEKSWSTT